MEERVPIALRTLIVRWACSATRLMMGTCRMSANVAKIAIPRQKGILFQGPATRRGRSWIFSVAGRRALQSVSTARRARQQNGLEARPLLCVCARQATTLPRIRAMHANPANIRMSSIANSASFVPPALTRLASAQKNLWNFVPRRATEALQRAAMTWLKGMVRIFHT